MSVDFCMWVGAHPHHVFTSVNVHKNSCGREKTHCACVLRELTFSSWVQCLSSYVCAHASISTYILCLASERPTPDAEEGNSRGVLKVALLKSSWMFPAADPLWLKKRRPAGMQLNVLHVGGTEYWWEMQQQQNNITNNFFQSACAVIR